MAHIKDEKCDENNIAKNWAPRDVMGGNRLVDVEGQKEDCNDREARKGILATIFLHLLLAPQLKSLNETL